MDEREIDYTPEELEELSAIMEIGPNAYVPYEPESMAYWSDALFEKHYGFPKPRTPEAQISIAVEVMAKNVGREAWEELAPSRPDSRPWQYFPMSHIPGFEEAFSSWAQTQEHIVSIRYRPEDGMVVIYRSYNEVKGA